MLHSGPLTQDDVKIVSADQAARTLGVEAHVNVEVSREMRQLPVLLDGRGAKPTELLRGLASALHASLVQDGNIVRITRTRTDQTALRGIDRKCFIESIQQRIISWDKELDRVPKSGSRGALIANQVHLNAVAISSHSSFPGVGIPRGIDPALLAPAGQLLRGLVARLPISEMSEIGPGEGKTFSNEPTPVENKLPNTDDLLRQFAADQASFAKDPALTVSQQDRRASTDEYLLPKSSVSLEGLKYLLVVVRDPGGSRFSLAIYNATGSFVSGAWVGTLARDNALPYQKARLIANQRKEATIDLQPEQVEFERATSVPQVQVPPNSSLWSHLLHPETYDPANYLVPTALKSWIESDQKPVIAVISDDVVMAAHYSVVGQTLNTAAFEALTSNSIEHLDESGIRIFRPRNPLWAEKYTCNRTRSGSALRRFVREGQVDLRGYSMLCYEQSDAMSYVPRQFLGAVRFSAVLPTCEMNMDSGFFEMLGSVTNERWEALENGQTIELNDDEFRARLWRVLQRIPYKPDDQDRLPEIAQRVTVSLPNGVPTSAKLSLKSRTDLAVRMLGKDSQNGQGDLDMASYLKILHTPLGSQLHIPSQLRMNQDRSLSERANHAFVAPATRTTTGLTFDIAPHFGFSFDLKSPCRILGPMGPFEKLPAAHLKAAQDEWNRLEAAGSDSQTGNGKGN